jgi:hypothetical protein
MHDRTAFRSTAALTVALVLAGLLVLVVLDPGRFNSLLDFGPGTPPAASENDDSVAEPVAGPRNTPPAGSSKIVIDPAHPFAGSPAANYPAGIAGLRMPAAKQAGAFSAKEVALALNLTRRYFAATRLDPKVIAGQYPTGVFALFEPHGAELLDPLRRGLRHPTATDDPTLYVTRLDPRQDVLHGSVVKVNGTATVRVGTPDQLIVSIDVLVVYATRRVDGPQEVTRVVLRQQQDLHTFHHNGRNMTPGLIWPGASALGWSGVTCESDGYAHPQYPSEWESTVGPSGADPYDARQPLRGDVGCGGHVRRV